MFIKKLNGNRDLRAAVEYFTPCPLEDCHKGSTRLLVRRSKNGVNEKGI
jgi:hypothetical protein